MSTEITDSEAQFMVRVMMHNSAELEVDWKAVAVDMGLQNPRSAQNRYRVIKNKFPTTAAKRQVHKRKVAEDQDPAKDGIAAFNENSVKRAKRAAKSTITKANAKPKVDKEDVGGRVLVGGAAGLKVEMPQRMASEVRNTFKAINEYSDDATIKAESE